jgi:hypothetical protein
MPQIGGAVGSVVSKIAGFGRYTVKSNSIMSNTENSNSLRNGPGQISFKSSGNSVRVRHSEYIGDVYSEANGLFNSFQYTINPANATTFPLLSGIADKFDQWKAHGIVFCFESTSSDFNGANQSLGTIAMATEYDVNDDRMIDMTSMLNTSFSCNTKPSCDLYHPIECDPQQTFAGGLLYTGAPSDLSDAKFYDLGKMTVAIQGTVSGASTLVLGRVRVVYDIELFKFQLPPMPNLSIVYSDTVDQGAVTPDMMTTTGKITTNQNGYVIGNNLGITVPIPAGYYLFTASVVGTGVNTLTDIMATAWQDESNDSGLYYSTATTGIATGTSDLLTSTTTYSCIKSLYVQTNCVSLTVDATGTVTTATLIVWTLTPLAKVPDFNG